MRRAEWRTRGDDPKTLLGWWWRGILEEDRLMGFRLLGLVCSMGALFAGVSWALMPLAVSLCLAHVLTRRAHSNRLGEVVPDPAPEGQFRASVEFRRKGLTTGTDDMALTVVDGWLHAEGVRSHFAVRPEDVCRLRTTSNRIGVLALADGSEVLLRGIRSETRVLLERWHVPDRWMEGEPTLPPARVHPQEFARVGAWMMAIASLFLLISLVRHVSTSQGMYVASLFGILVIFNTATVWSYVKLARLALINDRAKEEERSDALVEQAPPLQDVAERTIGESRAEVRNSLAE